MSIKRIDPSIDLAKYIEMKVTDGLLYPDNRFIFLASRFDDLGILRRSEALLVLKELAVLADYEKQYISPEKKDVEFLKYHIGRMYDRTDHSAVCLPDTFFKYTDISKQS